MDIEKIKKHPMTKWVIGAIVAALGAFVGVEYVAESEGAQTIIEEAL